MEEDFDGRRKDQLSAGEFLFYVAKVLLVLAIICLAYALAASYRAKAQGLIDDKPCITWVKAQAQAKEIVGVLNERGLKVTMTQLDPAMMQPIVTAMLGHGAVVPNPETINEGFLVEFPGGDGVVITLGAGACAVGTVQVPRAGWDALLESLGQAASK